jgi:DNA-binding response OmpR family regulator
MATSLQTLVYDIAERIPQTRLATRSLRDDEIRAIADALYRGDNPLRFESVRQAALMFERVGYSILRSPISPAPTTSRITVGRLVVDRAGRQVHYDGREIALKTREFDLLDVLARHQGQVFTRLQLLELAWPQNFDGGDRTVDVHIRRLRRSLGEPQHRPKLILTVHGIGYKLAAPRGLNRT